MKIAIIGKVNPDLVYDEWEKKIQTNLKGKSISHINITFSNGKLNQHVRKYAAAYNIPVSEYAADFKTYGDDAKLIRNLALIDNSDLLVGFLPKGGSEESWIYRPGITREKPAIVITC